MAVTSTTNIFKSGHSSAVRLNKRIMEAAGLHFGDLVNVRVNPYDGSIVITPTNSQDNHDKFAKLLDQSITDDFDALKYLEDK